MAKSPPEKLSAALRANLKRRKITAPMAPPGPVLSAPEPPQAALGENPPAMPPKKSA
ncbi:MAG TPA: hypothetical protein VG821_09870 [Rhizomicrobium sp.]|nr:hypothetical protein [Rhizomicrobium sp.]